MYNNASTKFIKIRGIKMTENKKLKIVLAYSGGLDTSTIVPWLK